MIEKEYIAKSYPEPNEAYTQELIRIIQENALPIEIIRIDSPTFEFEGVRTPIGCDRALELSNFISVVDRHVRLGATKLYLLCVDYKYDKLIIGFGEDIEYSYSDTFYVRWGFKK